MPPRTRGSIIPFVWRAKVWRGGHAGGDRRERRVGAQCVGGDVGGRRRGTSGRLGSVLLLLGVVVVVVVVVLACTGGRQEEALTRAPFAAADSLLGSASTSPSCFARPTVLGVFCSSRFAPPPPPSPPRSNSSRSREDPQKPKPQMLRTRWQQQPPIWHSATLEPG